MSAKCHDKNYDDPWTSRPTEGWNGGQGWGSLKMICFPKNWKKTLIPRIDSYVGSISHQITHIDAQTAMEKVLIILEMEKVL